MRSGTSAVVDRTEDAVYKSAAMAFSDTNPKFDLRTVQRYIKAGRVTKEDYNAHLESLADSSSNVMDPDAGGDDDGFDTPVANDDAPDAGATEPAHRADPAPVPPTTDDAPAPPPPPMEVPIGSGG